MIHLPLETFVTNTQLFVEELAQTKRTESGLSSELNYRIEDCILGSVVRACVCMWFLGKRQLFSKIKFLTCALGIIE